MKNKVYRTMKILLSVVLVFAISGILNFALSPVMYGHWVMHDRDKYAGKIDTLIVGDSYYMYAVQPSLLDKELGCFSFNESTASQSLKGSYYIIWDYIETENIKTVYIGLDHFNFLNNPQEDDSMSMRICYDRLKSSKVKCSLIKDVVNIDNVENWLFSVKMNRKNFLDIPKNIKNKLSYEYRNYLPLDLDGFFYSDRGYIYTEKVEHVIVNTCDMSEMYQEQVYWLEKIIKLCKENNITINIFQSPTQHVRMGAVENYEMYRDTIQDLSHKYGCKYYDFNFYYEREKMDDSTCFRDAVHMNDKGSKIFMEWFCNVFSYEEDVTDMFFNVT